MKISDYVFDIFRSKFEREDSLGRLVPISIKLIGIDDYETYNDILRYIVQKTENNKKTCLLFDSEIELNISIEMEHYIYSELKKLNLSELKNEDIIIFNDENKNKKFTDSLFVLNLLMEDNKTYKTENEKLLSLTKIILYAYQYITNISFDEIMNPVCTYYGTINTEEIYFLVLLAMMNFDVLYINPLKDEIPESIIGENIFKLEKYIGLGDYSTIACRAKAGKDITKLPTISKRIEDDIYNLVLGDINIYKPWQFRDKNTYSKLLDPSIEDLKTLWKEDARFREYFSFDNDTVTIPTFFTKIDGVYEDILEYKHLVDYLINDNNVFFNYNDNISRNPDMDININEALQLSFCQLNDGSFCYDEIKSLPFYRYKNYNKTIQKLIINKFNEFIKKDFMSEEAELDKNEIYKILYYLLTGVNDKLIQMIDTFDYSGKVPKIVIFLNGKSKVTALGLLTLAYFNTIGFDILIFNPSGMFNMDDILNPKLFTTIRLDKINYSLQYDKLQLLKDNKAKGFFKKLFN